MMKKSVLISCISCILLIVSKPGSAQLSLGYFIDQAAEHSPALNEYQNLLGISEVQNRLNRAQNSAFQLSVSSDYLFVPYFNNPGGLITTDPDPGAVGYEIALFDGGLYSFQVNMERNLFNGKLMNALDRQVRVQSENYKYSSALERHNLEKEVTDQYLNALRAARLVSLSKEIVSNLEQQLGFTAELVENGYINVQDYLLLKIEVKSQAINQRNVRQKYKSAILQLYELCGIQDTAIVDISPVVLEQSSRTMNSNFTQKYVLDSLATVAEQQLFETKYRPQLQLFMNAGLNAIELQDIEHKFGMSAGLSLLIPIFDGGQRDLTRQQSYLAKGTISQYRKYSEHVIALQCEDLRSQIESLRKDIESLTGQIKDFEDLLKISVKQLQTGNMSMIDYLALVRNFIELRVRSIEVETEYQLGINNYNYWNW